MALMLELACLMTKLERYLDKWIMMEEEVSILQVRYILYIY